MVSDAVVKLATFSMLLNIIFPVFAYAFTSLEGSDLENWDLSIDKEDLIDSGILFNSVSQENITFRGGPVTFNISGDLTRFNWERNLIKGDRITIRHPSPIEWAWGEITGDYFSLGGSDTSFMIDGILNPEGSLYNSSLVNYWDLDYNWTLINLKTLGMSALFTPVKGDPVNMTNSVYELGELTITLGSVRSGDGSFDAGSFVDFYWDMLIGSNDWGLPDSMAWIIRILTVFTTFSAVLLGRELLNPLS